MVASVIELIGEAVDGKFTSTPSDSGGGEGGVISSFLFNAGDDYSKVSGGMSFELGTREVSAPSGKTETGGKYHFPGDLDPTVQQTDEQRFAMSELREGYIKRRIFIPSNFTLRHITFTDMSTSIAGWQVGDSVTGTDGTSHGIIEWIAGNTVYYNYPDNGWDNSVWVGTLTNTTRSTTATSTHRSIFDNGNKFFVLFCDGYSNAGQSPTLIFGLNADTLGTVNIDFSIAVDGSVSGIEPNTHFDAVPFITSADLGKFANVYIHYKMSTDEDTYDGVVELWKQTDGASTPTKHITATNMNMGARAAASPSMCEFKQGYCFGWSNSGYKTTTDFFEAEFTVSSAPIDGVS